MFASARTLALVFAVCAALLSCSSGRLSSDEAKQVIAAHPLVQTSDNLTINGVSQAEGSADAIVQAQIDDSALNLKLRRYDQSWRWEFVETRAGTWIPPEEAIAQLREARRQQRLTSWAKEHMQQYATTVALLHELAHSLPRRPSMSLLEGIVMSHQFNRRPLQRKDLDPQERERIERLYADPPVDAWGRRVAIDFDGAERTATFTSDGPDKVTGTRDDAMCIAKGIREWDNDYDTLLFNYTTAFVVPEGLENAVAPYLVHKFAVGAARRPAEVKYVKLID